uniref:Uncharacterized protein n=1 Tax=Chenopodium quinoa TaxID=63459 RepID=A0A803L7J1_CHEQI
MAEKLWIDIPQVQISVNLDYERNNWPPTGPPDIVIPLSSIEPAKCELWRSQSPHYAMTNKMRRQDGLWHTTKAVAPLPISQVPIIKGLAFLLHGFLKILDFGPLDLKHIMGVGTRLVYFYTAFNLPGDGM